jgi:hypothetical protein
MDKEKWEASLVLQPRNVVLTKTGGTSKEKYLPFIIVLGSSPTLVLFI